MLHFVRGNSSWARVNPKDGVARVLGHTVGKITKDERTNESVGFVPEESPQEVVKGGQGYLSGKEHQKVKGGDTTWPCLFTF